MENIYAEHGRPDHLDDFGGRHYPPLKGPPPTQRPRRPLPRYEEVPGKESMVEDPLPRRAPPPPSSSPPSASSAPMRRPPPRRSPRKHPQSPMEESYYAPRRDRRRHREEDYFSGSAERPKRRHHDAPRERHRHHHDASRDRERKAERKAPPPEPREKKWQKHGKKLFQEYAVPAIKAEGTKYISKQIGKALEKGIEAV